MKKSRIPPWGRLPLSGSTIGGPSRVEDLETLFKSNDLTVRVFRKYNLWPIVLADKFDPTTGKVKPAWTDRLFGNEKGPKPPGDWDAIRAAKDRLKVSVNKKAGTVFISFESPSAEGSANIVKYFLDEGKSRLQEEALDRATKNKKFIEEQIGKTVDALDAGSSLLALRTGSRTGDDGPEPGTVRVQGDRLTTGSGQENQT